MTYDDIIKKWNSQADEFNDWDTLSETERIEFIIFEKDKKIKHLTKRDEVWKAKKELLETDLADSWAEIKLLKSVVREITESRDEWKRSWHLESAHVHHSEEELDRLKDEFASQGENVEKYISTIGQMNREIDRLRNALETVQASYTIETPEIVKQVVDEALKGEPNET